MASWYGTDLFLENYKNQSNIGGYLSYSEKDVSTCIFFSPGEAPKVIGTIVFGEDYNVKTARLDLKEREFTAGEKDLFQVRSAALKIINSDTLFKTFENTNLNIIPIISNGERKVYVLTGTQKSGVVIIGNDYLITFDENNQVNSKKALHANIIPIETTQQTEPGTEAFGTMHSHLPETGDFITPTDICTLMLYAKFTNWKQHIVVSEKYMNIWNIKDNHLIVVPREVEKGSSKKKKKN